MIITIIMAIIQHSSAKVSNLIQLSQWNSSASLFSLCLLVGEVKMLGRVFFTRRGCWGWCWLGGGGRRRKNTFLHPSFAWKYSHLHPQTDDYLCSLTLLTNSKLFHHVYLCLLRKWPPTKGKKKEREILFLKVKHKL